MLDVLFELDVSALICCELLHIPASDRLYYGNIYSIHCRSYRRVLIEVIADALIFLPNAGVLGIHLLQLPLLFF